MESDRADLEGVVKITPLHIEIMLHYNCGTSDYRDGDFSAPAVSNSINELYRNELLKNTLTGNDRFCITEKGRAWIYGLCQTPMPIQKWVMP